LLRVTVCVIAPEWPVKQCRGGQTPNNSKDELVKIARSITLASNVNDRSTWFDATV